MIQIVQDKEILKQKSVPVEDGEDISKIIDDMKETLTNTPNGAALAAIQIGVPKRIFIVKRQDENKKEYFDIYINPEIKDQYDKVVVPESCLSFPGEWIKTHRFQYCHLIHRERPTGNVFDNFGAQVIQHEIDHLDGKTMYDREYVYQPMTTKSEKIGRNAPCSCGSGKKLKKCCGK